MSRRSPRRAAHLGTGRTPPPPHRRRAAVPIVVLVAVVALLVGVVPVAGGDGASTVAAAATPAYTQGSGPLADVLYWADQKKCEDLTRDELAAMIIVPSYTETGASGTVAPSPMKCLAVATTLPSLSSSPCMPLT